MKHEVFARGDRVRDIEYPQFSGKVMESMPTPSPQRKDRRTYLVISPQKVMTWIPDERLRREEANP